VDVLLQDLWPSTAGRNALQSRVPQVRCAPGGKDLVVAEDDTYRPVITPDFRDAA